MLNLRPPEDIPPPAPEAQAAAAAAARSPEAATSLMYNVADASMSCVEALADMMTGVSPPPHTTGMVMRVSVGQHCRPRMGCHLFVTLEIFNEPEQQMGWRTVQAAPHITSLHAADKSWIVDLSIPLPAMLCNNFALGIEKLHWSLLSVAWMRRFL